MTVIPPGKEDMIAFFAAHVPVWTARAAEIGLDPQSMAELSALLSDAQSKLTQQNLKEDEKLAATADSNLAAKALRTAGAADLATIKAFAKKTGDTSVYIKAQIPEPSDPSERPAPPQPVVKTPVQLSGGIIRVEFTVTTGGGAQYLVQRADTRLDNTTTNWFPVGTVTEKFFRDEAIPFGLRQVQYRVAAQISSGPVSEWSEPATFSFGTQGSQAGPMAKAPGTLGSIEPVKPEDQKGAG